MGARPAGETAANPQPKTDAARYTQVKISVNPDLAFEFKKACAASKVSMASQLSRYMAGFCCVKPKQEPSRDYTTRRRRRSAVGRLLTELGKIRDAEERYMENIPANLQGSVVYDNAEQAVSAMDEALDILASVY